MNPAKKNKVLGIDYFECVEMPTIEMIDEHWVVTDEHERRINRLEEILLILKDKLNLEKNIN